jgi:hypothetical protein
MICFGERSIAEIDLGASVVVPRDHKDTIPLTFKDHRLTTHTIPDCPEDWQAINVTIPKM